jgi:formate dehydrogenase iron-sulfur subunit
MATVLKSKGALIDLTKCIGCRGCQVACKSWNSLGVRKTTMTGNFTNPLKLNSDTYTLVKFVETTEKLNLNWDFIKVQCMHCKEPACASACPVGAFKKQENGAVSYTQEKCIGCRYCMVACPFGIPKYEWEKRYPIVQKCTFCAERLDDGMMPACAKSCAPGAIYFDDQEKVIAEAERRLKAYPDRYVNHIYGKEEAGGTAWVYLSSVPFKDLGFRTDIPNKKLPDLTWDMLSSIPYKVGGLVVLLSAIALFRNRGSNASEDSQKGKEG